MAPSWVPPLSNYASRQGEGLEVPPNVPFSGAKTIKANARKPIEFDQRCAQLLENEALAREWASIYGPIQSQTIKMHKGATKRSF